MTEKKLAALAQPTEPAPAEKPKPVPVQPQVELDQANEKLASLLNKPK
jgi:hypothetical protein